MIIDLSRQGDVSNPAPSDEMARTGLVNELETSLGQFLWVYLGEVETGLAQEEFFDAAKEVVRLLSDETDQGYLQRVLQKLKGLNQDYDIE